MPREPEILYTPTPDEIAAETALIRAGWSEAEERRRAMKFRGKVEDFGRAKRYRFQDLEVRE